MEEWIHEAEEEDRRREEELNLVRYRMSNENFSLFFPSSLSHLFFVCNFSEPFFTLHFERFYV